MSFKIRQEITVCGGKLLKLSHFSQLIGSNMDLNVYLPKQYYAKNHEKTIPTIYYLSGLTCTPDNASEKAFWQFQADKYGFAMVFPDTSPRGENIPDDPEKSWDFGIAAGFYINATVEPFSKYYVMYDYIHKELPSLLDEYFKNSSPILDFLENVAITGHSMGGYGALTGYLKNYEANRYKSCSAFAPIVNPSNVPWGKKAFKGYLGDNKTEWAKFDPCVLVKGIANTRNERILIHQGTNDPFLKENLKTELLTKAIKGTSWEETVKINMVDGYDHSYYFVSTFVPEHAEFHAHNLGLI